MPGTIPEFLSRNPTRLVASCVETAVRPRNVHRRERPAVPARQVQGQPQGNRRILAILAAIIAVGLVLGVVLRRSDNAAPGAGDARAGAAPHRTLGPSGGRLAPHGRAPSAADVLGALGRGTSGDVATVEGHVIDAVSRAPVGGVEVVFVGRDGETTVDAAADGGYAIELPRGEYRAFVRGDYVISVGAAPYERLPAPPDPTAASAPDDALATMVSVGAAQRGVDLEVQRSGIVLGKVVDPTGRPVVGAVVRVANMPWRPVLGTHIAESGVDGTFRLEVPSGYYELEAAHPDFAGPEPKNDAMPGVMVYPEMETSTELTLARGCVITGRAVRRDGSPVGPGALERGYGDDQFGPVGTIADDGTFRFATVQTDDVTLRAWPWKAPPAAGQTVACRDGGRHVLEFVVPDQSPDLTGRIESESGVAVPGAYVDVYGMTPGTMNQQERSDATGEWAVYALPPGEYSITAHVPGQGIATRHVTVPGRDIVLRLSGTGSITGRVEGLAEGETFQLQVAGCVSDRGSVVVPPSTQVVPVESGAYHVDGLPACTVIAYARTARRTQAIQVEVRAGAQASFDLDLAPPRAKTVRLSVVDEHDTAVPGAQVMVVHMDVAAQAGPTPDPVNTDGRGVATVEAHVGDLIKVFYVENRDDAVVQTATYTVSDAAGPSEDAGVKLEPTPYFGP